MYVILGATGNTGSLAAQALLAKGEKVRAVGRSKERLASLVGRGAEAFEADIEDSVTLTRAFEGARAVYFMVPPDPQNADYRASQKRIIEAGATALEAARVRYAVALSSYGADQESGLGPVSGLHGLETRFSKISGLNVLFFRAGYFMENLLPQAGVIQNFGMVAGPVRADVSLPMIATRDIGAAVADALLKLDFSGQQTRELQGQRDVSYNEAARIIGSAIGKPNLAYLELPKEQFLQALTGMGASRNFAESLFEMVEGINDGRMKALEPRTAANSTPTPIETFAQDVFAPAYRGGKAATA